MSGGLISICRLILCETSTLDVTELLLLENLTDLHSHRMTAVQPLSQSHAMEESTTVTRARKTRQACHEVSVAAANDVIPDVSEQSNRNSVEDGFCGESFADKGELLSSLSPLLFSMKLCGLYFHREHRHRRPTDDPEWNQTTTTTGTTSTKLRVYATIILIIFWFNYVRLASAFTSSDHFGAVLLMKITVFTWSGLVAIFQTTYYIACHTGQLVKILLSLPVTRDCVRGAHRVAIGITAFTWITLISNISTGAYVFFNDVGEHNFILAPFFTYIYVPEAGAYVFFSDVGEHNFILAPFFTYIYVPEARAYVFFSGVGEHNFILAPFFTYIYVPEDKVEVTKMIGYLGYMLTFPTVMFAHSMSIVLVYIFYNQFKKLEKHFRRALGERGQFSGDLSAFRQRHQTLSCAVNKVDSFMMLSNVAGFVCHVCNIIILFYSIIFYPETRKDIISVSTYVFWLSANINGLLFSASVGIIVNHMVRNVSVP